MDAGNQHDPLNIPNPERRVSVRPFSKPDKGMNPITIAGLALLTIYGLYKLGKYVAGR